jgi:hypothetical protein
MGYQVIGIDRTETGDEIISRPCLESERPGNTARTSTGARNDVVSDRYIVKDSWGAHGETVEVGIDVAQTSLR